MRLLSSCLDLAIPSLFICLYFIDPATAEDACYIATRIVTRVLIVENPVYINTNVLSNTSFSVNPDLTITASNAPTSLDLKITYALTKSTVVVSLPSAVAPGSIKDGNPFVLSVGDNQPSHERRQTGGSSYLGSNGGLTTSCTTANTYSLQNGQLFATINGTVEQYSTSAGVTYAQFLPSASVGTITTTFSLGAKGDLLWSNSAFYNGNALFCILPSGSIIVVFSLGAQPSGCVFIDLTISDGMSFPSQQR